jgi:hypothetical protein
MKTRTLTIGDAITIGTMVNMWHAGNRVRFSTDDGATITTGTVRHIVRSETDYTFLGSGDDIRDGWLRITTVGGWDIALAVPTVIDLIRDGLFVTD